MATVQNFSPRGSVLLSPTLSRSSLLLARGQRNRVDGVSCPQAVTSVVSGSWRVFGQPTRVPYELTRAPGISCSKAGRRGTNATGAGTEVEASDAAADVAGVDSDEEATQDLKDVQDIIETMELLKKRRQMTVQETRLVLMIEDPREAERRRQLGIESASGCSREELAAAFMEVMEDRVPGDRLALRKLAQEMRDWPRLRDVDDDEAARKLRGSSLYAEVTNVGLSGSAKSAQRRAGSDSRGAWDAAAEVAQAEADAKKEKQKDLGETLPPWVGYGFLYGISSIPIIIVVLVIIILFVNSLQ